MTKKTIGYIELEWTCPNCGNKNAGMLKSCTACGSPQPEKIQFELGKKQDLISDDKKTANAAKGADIHCPFCNTRNPADAKMCTQCGGDLIDGIRHESGRVLSAGPTNPNIPVKCPNCGTIIQPDASTCSACGASLKQSTMSSPPARVPPVEAKQKTIRPWMALPGIAILMVCCVIIGLLFFKTSAVSGVVQDVKWERTISIEKQRPVTREAWQDELPADTAAISCEQAFRRRQDNPAPGSKEVCSTELVDQGNGTAKIVETCFYEIYDNYCKYSAMEWQTADQAVANGVDLQPYWPPVNINLGQREGNRTETYTVSFDTKDGIKQFVTSDVNLFSQLQPGSQWTLSINTLGAIVEVSP
jgi:hypothetical protein